MIPTYFLWTTSTFVTVEENFRVSIPEDIS